MLTARAKYLQTLLHCTYEPPQWLVHKLSHVITYQELQSFFITCTGLSGSQMYELELALLHSKSHPSAVHTPPDDSTDYDVLGMR